MGELFDAIKLNDYEKVKTLIENGIDVDIQNWLGYTTLRVVAWEGNIEITKLLIEKGAKLNIQDNDGRTALYYAVSRNDKKLVKLLLNNGVDINIRDKYGISVLRMTKSAEITELLKKYPKVLPLYCLCLNSIRNNKIDKQWIPEILFEYPKLI
jgi:ankyrin repeat protein